MSRVRGHPGQVQSSPSRSALLLLFVILTFGFTRFLMLRFPEGRNSTAIWIFASYGFEAEAASERHLSVYDLRASNVRDSLRGSASTIPGAGVIEYPPLAISWLALPVHFTKGHRDSTGQVTTLGRRQYSGVLRAELAAIDLICLCFVAFTLGHWLQAGHARRIGGIASYVLCTSLMFTLLYDR